MNLFERLAQRVRHSPAVREAAPLWDLVRPAYQGLLELGWGRVGLERLVNGTLVRVRPDHRQAVQEVYEPETWRAVFEQVKPGDTIVEVGSHVGIYTVALARRVGPTGSIIAFEPEPTSLAALRAHVHMNEVEDRVVVVAAAVGERGGLAEFATGRGSESRLARGDDARITVPAVTLDAALADRRVDGLKIDVEGAELLVLRGASALLGDEARRPRWVLVEVHPFAWDLFQVTSELLLAELARHGYEARGLDGEPIDRITRYGWLMARPGPV